MHKFKTIETLKKLEGIWEKSHCHGYITEEEDAFLAYSEAAIGQSIVQDLGSEMAYRLALILLGASCQDLLSKLQHPSAKDILK